MPDALWLLLALPALAAAPLLAFVLRRRALRRLGREENVEALRVGRPAGFRAARAVLLLLALGGLVLALARPQYGARTRILRKRGVDVVVALDFSKSMLAQDVRPSRIERAKAELIRLLGELEGDRVGLVAFAGETMEFPMTIDAAAAALFFRDLGPYDMPVGGTAIGRALIASKNLLERSAPRPPAGAAAPADGPETRRSRVVILLTDGEDHEGDPVAAARELAEAGIRVVVVGIGSGTGEPIPTYAPDGTWTGYMRDDDGQPILTALTAQNEAQLREIARVANGRYIRARRGTVGTEEIRAFLRGLKQEENRARRVTVHEDRYVLALLPAFLLLLLETLLPEAWVGRRRPAPPPPAPRRAGWRARGRPGSAAAGVASTTLAIALAGLGSGLAALATALAALAVWLAPARARAWEWRDLFRREQADVAEGNARLRAGDAESALRAYDRALRAHPDEARVHLDRGLALLAKGDLAKAREEFLRATEPPASAELRAAAYYDMGLAFFREAEAAAQAAADAVLAAGGAQPGTAPAVGGGGAPVGAGGAGPPVAGVGTGGAAPGAAPARADHRASARLFREAADAFRRSLRLRPGNRDAAWNLELALRRARAEDEAQRAEDERRRQEQQQRDRDAEQDPQPGEQPQDSPSQSEDPQSRDGDREPSDSPDSGDTQRRDGEPDTPPQQDGAPQQDGRARPEQPQDRDAPTPSPESRRDDSTSPRQDGDLGGDAERGRDGTAGDRLPAEAARVLDALDDGEQNLERYRARMRALRENRRPTKDW
jgi:Ca-activated chloride channel family protein